MLFATLDVRRWLVELFVVAGAPPTAAEVVADHLVDATVLGVGSHGVMRAADYLDAIRAGDWDPAATPCAVEAPGATVRIDGRRGFGQPAALLGVDLAVELAADHGVALAMIGRAAHFGRIGAYVEAIARAGYVGMAFCATPPAWRGVAWHGSREAVIGTNPLAFGVPTTAEPIVADLATSATSEGRVKLARALGRPAPDDALIDARGAVTTDPNALYAEPRGALLPFGGMGNGHKGSALALLVEAMGRVAPIAGAGRGADANSLTLVVIAVDADLPAAAAEIVERVHASAPINPAHPPRVPGARHAELRAETELIDVDDLTVDRLVAASRLAGVDEPGPASRL